MLQVGTTGACRLEHVTLVQLALRSNISWDNPLGEVYLALTNIQWFQSRPPPPRYLFIGGPSKPPDCAIDSHYTSHATLPSTSPVFPPRSFRV